MTSIGSGTARSFSTIRWMVARSLYTGTTTDSFGMSIAPPAGISGGLGQGAVDVGVEQREPEVIGAAGGVRPDQVVRRTGLARLSDGEERAHRPVEEGVRGDPEPAGPCLLQQRPRRRGRRSEIAPGERLAERDREPHRGRRPRLLDVPPRSGEKPAVRRRLTAVERSLDRPEGGRPALPAVRPALAGR